MIIKLIITNIKNMVASVDRDKCMYCGGCVSICPTDALELMETFIKVDEDTCVGCGSCIRFCPVGALYEKDE